MLVMLFSLQIMSQFIDMFVFVVLFLVLFMLSVVVYNSLCCCLYQFFVGCMFCLGELEEVFDELEKCDIGEILYVILYCFYWQLLEVLMYDLVDCQGLLLSIIDELFGLLLVEDGNVLCFYWCWFGVMLLYLVWQVVCEVDGWCFEVGEVDVDMFIMLLDECLLCLCG